jgi:multicomponent Na+:H+ antiporter subunit F
MIPAGSDVLTITLNGALIVLSVALLLALYRLVRGPSLPDRVVALDLTAILAVGVISVYSIATDQAALLDAALVLALIVFLGTVTFARYLERGGVSR